MSVKTANGGPGVDHVTIEQFEQDLDSNLKWISDRLRDGTYRPLPIRRKLIPKPGSRETRPLGIPTVRDRVVQTALRLVIEPIFEIGFADYSFGFRPNRGCKDALSQVDYLLKSGHRWVVDADLKGYFDTIDHDLLKSEVRKRIKDGRVMDLIDHFLTQEVMDTMNTWRPGVGTPQGAVISPLLANIFLNPLDHLMASQGFEMIRYADDFVVVCRSEQEAQAALEQIQAWTDQTKLTLHPTKTQLIDFDHSHGFDFLGYRFQLEQPTQDGRYRQRGVAKWPKAKNLKKLKDEIRRRTKRCNRFGMQQIISRLNPLLRGWYEYFKHSHSFVFGSLDGWIRRRLRSILRRQNKLKGISKGGKDHQRWRIKFFHDLGLFNMKAAFERECQPRLW